jgi:hypothetical protein
VRLKANVATVQASTKTFQFLCPPDRTKYATLDDFLQYPFSGILKKKEGLQHLQPLDTIDFKPFQNAAA